MKKMFFVLFISIISLTTKAQNKVDFGIYGGASFYMGDLNHTKLFYSPKPSIGGILRYNINRRYAMRFSTINTTLAANDADFDNDYQKLRGKQFESNITDIAAQLVFSFFPYSTVNDKHRASPYVTAGLGGVFTENGFKFTLPIGVGFKFNITHRFSAGVDWSFRRAFSDTIDGLKPTENNKKQLSYSSNEDWYSLFGAFILIRLSKGDTKCRAYW